jgi:CrcB protein
MIRIILLIWLGSGIGGVLRYLSQQFIQKRFPSSFPYGTLWVNVTACFLIGIIYALAEKGNILSPQTRLFLATGICGGYSTFSSFAYENIALMQDGAFIYLLLYVATSIILGFSATYLGILFIKSI